VTVHLTEAERCALEHGVLLEDEAKPRYLISGR